jgi:hypothetical protein
MRSSRVTPIAAFVALGASLAFAGDPAADLTDEDRADLAWFEGLGYPKLGGLPFIEVRPGWDTKFRGLLVSDDGARFRVIGLDLTDAEYVRTPGGTPEDRRVAYEGLDVEDVAERWLAGGVAPGGEPGEFPRDERASALTEAFVFACALAQEPKTARWFGPGLVHDLLAHARTMRPDRWRRQYPEKSPREFMAADLARVAHRHAVSVNLRGDDGAAGRRASLEAHRAVARRFPGTPEAETSQRLAAGLERQIREDAEHATSAKPLDQLTGDERVSELVFRLRDQEANGFGANGGMGQITDGPYRELVALGLAAVPKLLGAIEDEGPSRCATYGGGGWSASAVSVGSLAFGALGEIAGRRFGPPEAVKVDPYDPANWRAACRASIEAWWADAQKVGEAASLARVVEAGGYGALDAAEMLAKKDPARFAAAIVMGARASTDWDARWRLIAIAAKHPSDTVTEFLLDEMRAAPVLYVRVLAANALLAVRRDAAVAAMLGEWRLRREGKAPKPADDGSGSPVDETAPLVAFFVRAQDPAALRALGEGLAQRPMAVRVETYGGLAEALGLDWRGMHSGWWWGEHTKLAEPAAIAAAEDVLALALDDASDLGGEVMGAANERGFDMRLADVAAAALGIRRGGGPTVAMSVEQRARARALVANLWRKEHGLAPVAVPAPPEIPRVPDTEIAPMLAWFVEAPREWKDVHSHLDAVDALGLGALAPLREFLDSGKKGTWDKDLRALAARIAFHVRRVNVDATEAALPAAFRVRAESWLGRALSGGDLAAFAGDIVRTAPTRLAGFVLVADRPGDGTGVVVTLRCTEGDRPNRAAFWTRAVSAARGTEDVGSQNSCGSIVTPTAADFLADGADRPFTAAPGERAYVRIDVR